MHLYFTSNQASASGRRRIGGVALVGGTREASLGVAEEEREEASGGGLGGREAASGGFIGSSAGSRTNCIDWVRGGGREV